MHPSNLLKFNLRRYLRFGMGGGARQLHSQVMTQQQQQQQQQEQQQHHPGAVMESNAEIAAADGGDTRGAGKKELGATAEGGAEDDDDDEVDDHEEMMKKLHPELRSQVRRFGLLFLPYSQRTWFWELFSMSNKLIMSMTAGSRPRWCKS